MGVDGVTAERRYQPMAPPFGRHSRAEHKFLPRRPLPRQAWVDGANRRLRHRSTANPSALSRLFRWLRHSLLLGQLPVYLCSQTILPHVCGDAVTYRLRQLRGYEVGGRQRVRAWGVGPTFTSRLRRGKQVGQVGHLGICKRECPRRPPRYGQTLTCKKTWVTIAYGAK